MKASEEKLSLLHKYITDKMLVTFHILKRYKFVPGPLMNTFLLKVPKHSRDCQGHPASETPQRVITLPAFIVTELYKHFYILVCFK